MIEALAVLREPSACEPILDRFDDDELRSTAIAAMVSIGYLPPLLDALHSPSKRKRMGSITALRKLAHPESISALLVAFNAAEDHEKQQILQALSSTEKL